MVPVLRIVEELPKVAPLNRPCDNARPLLVALTLREGGTELVALQPRTQRHAERPQHVGVVQLAADLRLGQRLRLLVLQKSAKTLDTRTSRGIFPRAPSSIRQ